MLYKENIIGDEEGDNSVSCDIVAVSSIEIADMFIIIGFSILGSLFVKVSFCFLVGQGDLCVFHLPQLIEEEVLGCAFLEISHIVFERSTVLLELCLKLLKLCIVDLILIGDTLVNLITGKSGIEGGLNIFSDLSLLFIGELGFKTELMNLIKGYTIVDELLLDHLMGSLAINGTLLDIVIIIGQCIRIHVIVDFNITDLADTRVVVYRRAGECRCYHQNCKDDCSQLNKMLLHNNLLLLNRNSHLF